MEGNRLQQRMQKSRLRLIAYEMKEKPPRAKGKIQKLKE